MVLRIYWDILKERRSEAFVGIVLLGATGIMEGLALLALLPVLQSGNLVGERTGAAGYVGDLVRGLAIGDQYLIHAAIGVFVILAVMTALVRLGADALVLRIRTRTEESARRRMGGALLDMSWSRFIAMRLGDISKAMVLEGQQMGTGAQFFLQGIGMTLASVAYLIVALTISIKMTVFTSVFVIVGGLAYFIVERKVRKHADQLSGIGTTISEQIGDIFGHLKFFRATGRGEAAGQTTKEIYRRYERKFFFSQIYGYVMRFGYELGATVFVGVFLAMSIFVYKEPLAFILIFLAVFYRLIPRLLMAQQSFFNARVYVTWYSTWRQRLDAAVAHRELAPGTEMLSEFESLSFEDVEFRYPETEEVVLENVNLKVRKGDCVAIVGPSGSGKTTMTDLITGLLRPSAGAVCVNGMELTRLDFDAWRRKIGLVMQDAPVFHTSILENIAWADPEPDHNMAEQAARMAHAWEFISKYPEGLDRVVGEKGGRLSGGQRQRLALARALYQEPWLLLLDEATSALDSASEAIVQNALEGIKGQCTILLVAHRLKTAQIADRIIVLEHGRIVEHGAWGDLLAQREGVFRRFAMLQGLAQA